MKLNMKLQKYLFIICFSLGIATFIYALVFMTDYQVLFGFEAKQNRPIAEFYSGKLQLFNRSVLRFGILMILGYGFMWFTRIKTEVCNFFTLVIDAVISIFVVVRAVLNIFSLREILGIFLSLDFSYTHLEGLENYEVNTRMLDSGIVLNGVTAIVAAAFLAVIIINFFRYLSLHEGVKTYFRNLKKNSLLNRMRGSK